MDKETKLCISIAKFPGNLGVKVHNAAYRELGLNYIYLPFGIEENALKKAIDAIRTFNIKGCGVSMPFKSRIMQYLDEIDKIAGIIGAVNTIVNNNGLLKGYNTDFNGVYETLPYLRGRSVLMLGAGGVAKAIGLAVKERQGALSICNRTEYKAMDLARKIDAELIPWEERQKYHFDLLINATSVGMNSDETPVDKNNLEQFDEIFDVVTSPLESRIIADAKTLGKIVHPGYRMCIMQAAVQFKLYTGKDAPLEVMEKAVKELLGDKK